MMVAQKKLTKRIVDSADYKGDASKGERCVVWDSDLPGFGLRVYPSGKKSFVLSYRHNNRKRLLTVGRYGPLTVAQARAAARKHLAEIIDGGDPLWARQQAKRGKTVRDLCQAYMERHAIHKKSSHDDKRRIDQHVIPAWGQLRADAITRSDAAYLHSKMGKHSGPYEANRTLSLLSKIFELGSQWGYLPDGGMNPARGTNRFKEEKRDRWLTPEELPRLIEAINHEPNESAKFAIWLFLLTGLRKNELLRAKWSDIDEARSEIRISDTKAGRVHYLPLSTSALAVLDKIPRHRDNPYILIGGKPGSHLKNIAKPWGRIRKAARVDDVRIHDLRRTVGSWLAQSGNSLHLIGRVLNHSSQRATSVYARFGQDSVREALEAHGQRVLGIAGVTEPAEVISIKK